MLSLDGVASFYLVEATTAVDDLGDLISLAWVSTLASPGEIVVNLFVSPLRLLPPFFES